MTSIIRTVGMAIVTSLLLTPHLAGAQTDAEKAAVATAKSKADELENLLKAQKLQHELNNLQATLSADTEKAQKSNDAAENKAALDLLKAQQEITDKQLTNVSSAIKGIGEVAAKSDIKDVSVSGDSIETVALAYQALDKAVKQMVDNLSTTPCPATSTLLLVDEPALAALLSYQTTSDELARLWESYSSTIELANITREDLRAGFEQLRKTKAADPDRSIAAAAVAMQGIYAAATLLQTFKTQMAVSSRPITADQTALMSLLAAHWSAKPGPKPRLVVYPNLIQPLTESPIMVRLNALSGAYDSGRTAEAMLSREISRRRAALGEPKANVKESDVVVAQRQLIDDASDALAAVKSVNADMGKIIASVSPIGSASALTTLIRSGYLYNHLKNGQPALQVKVISLGGNTMTTNNFWRGAKVFRSGGAILAYHLVNAQGEFAAGSVLSSQTGYRQLDGDALLALGDSWRPEDKQVPASMPATKVQDPSDGAQPFR